MQQLQGLPILQWTGPTKGRRWDGDTGVGLPPVARLLEERGALGALPELEANEVYTERTLQLLTEEDLNSCFSRGAAALLRPLLASSPQQRQQQQQPLRDLNLIPPQLPPAPPQQLSAQSVQHLIEERERARRLKDYTTADTIRDHLRTKGIRVNDETRTWLQPNGMLGGTWAKQEPLALSSASLKIR